MSHYEETQNGIENENEKIFDSEYIEGPAEKSRLFARLGQIPLIISVCEYVSRIYASLKGANLLFFLILDRFEDLLVYITNPILFIFERQVFWLDDVADSLLEALQNRFPVVNEPPTEQKQRLKRLYDNSAVKKRIDHAKMIRNRTVNKVKETEVKFNLNVTKTFNKADMAIDKYVAGSERPKKQTRLPPKQPVIFNLYERILESMVRFFKAVQHRIVHLIYQTIDITLASIYLFFTALQSISGYFFELTYIVASWAQQFAVVSVKKLSSTASGLSDVALENVVPYMPGATQKPAASVLVYVHHWRDRVEKTATIADVCAVLVDETKKNFQSAQDFMILNTYENGNPVHQRF